MFNLGIFTPKKGPTLTDRMQDELTRRNTADRQHYREWAIYLAREYRRLLALTEALGAQSSTPDPAPATGNLQAAEQLLAQLEAQEDPPAQEQASPGTGWDNLILEDAAPTTESDTNPQAVQAQPGIVEPPYDPEDTRPSNPTRPQPEANGVANAFASPGDSETLPTRGVAQAFQQQAEDEAN